MTTETQGAPTIDPLDLRNLIETMPWPVVCALPDGSVEFVNRAWQEYTGCSLQQLSGWVWQTTIHPDDVAKFIDELTVALAERETVPDRGSYPAGRWTIPLVLNQEGSSRYSSPWPRIILAHVDRLRGHS